MPNVTNHHPGLTDEIAAYCQRNNCTLTDFGIFAMRDPRFVHDVMRGRKLRPSTQRRVQDALERPFAKVQA